MYYSFKVQSPASAFFIPYAQKSLLTTTTFSKGGPTARSPRHRALCGRRPALLIGRVLLPELMEEVVLLVRKQETRFHLKGKTLNRTDCETERGVGVTFTVWMARPPRCSRRISMAWFTVMETERRSSRQAATAWQEKNRRAGAM